MAFWGVEVKPGKPYTHIHDATKGKLRLTQATLGNGTSPKRVIVQCNVGDNSPVLLCALLPERYESLSLDLEFEEEKDVVFSVVGPKSVHLCGYFLGPSGRGDGDDTDSYGEDIAESEGDYTRSSDSEDGYEEDFINDDDDLDMFPPSPKPNSGVVTEIGDEEEPVKGTDGSRRLRKQVIYSDNDDVDGSEHQTVLKQDATQHSDTEDDDGFPVSLSLKNKSDAKSNAIYIPGKIVDDGNEGKDAAGTEAASQRITGQSTKEADTKLKKKRKEQLKIEKNSVTDYNLLKDENVNTKKAQDADSRKDGEPDESEKSSKLKNKKKKMKRGETKGSVPVLPGERTVANASEGGNLNKDGEGKTIKNKKDVHSCMVLEETGKSNKKNKKKRAKNELLLDSRETDRENEGDRNINIGKSEKKQKKSKSDIIKTDGTEEAKEVTGQVGEVKLCQTRSFSDGLVIEKVSMGEPDAQIASRGKKVSVNYTGKLQNGKIFDSNIDRQPFQFRLGVGEVIKGWDVGVNGMHIGDKRRLTIPPSLGYGSQNMGKIPANSTLIFDIELVAVT